MAAEYELVIEGRAQKAQAGLDQVGGGVSLMGREYKLAYQWAEPGRLRLEVDGCVHWLFVADLDGARQVFVNGRVFTVEDKGRESARRGGKAGARGPDAVTPPMPAKVVRLLAEVGQRVAKGDGVMVVSAMKMETTLAAPHDGVVLSINAAVGDKVMPGQVLADISKEESHE